MNSLLNKLLKTVKTSANFSEEELENSWEQLLEILHNEDNEENLGHYFTRGQDVITDSIMDVIQGKADLKDDSFQDLLNNLKSATPSSFWNESVNNALTHFLTDIEIVDDAKAIPGTNGQISYNDIIKANAGYRFSFVNNNADDTNWVKPWKNIDKAKYQDVRAGDEIVKGVLNNKNELQFTHTQSQVDGNDTKFANWIRLLMPKYGRHVEIEDLDRNFWVIGQTVSGISAYLFDDDSPIKTAFKNILREITELWENILYLWAALAILNRKGYTDIHKEVIYLPVDEYKPYLKYDGIRLNTPNWNEICKRCASYIQSYPESNLALLIAKREGVYYHNYYSTELYSGLLLYNRNSPNTQANTYGFSIVTFGDEDCGENFQSAQISLGTKIDGNITYGDCVYAIREDNNKYIYCAPYSNVSKKQALNKNAFYGLLRVIPSFNAEYDKTNNKVKITNLKLSVYDAASRAIGQGAKLISELTLPGTTVSHNDPIQSATLNTEKKITNLPSCDISEIEIGAENVSGYYQGELVSNFKTNSLITYTIDEDSVSMPPITTDDPGEKNGDIVIRSDHKTFYYDILQAKDDIAQANYSILHLYKKDVMPQNKNKIKLIVGTRRFDMYKAKTESRKKKKSLVIEATGKDGLGGYYAEKAGKNKLYIKKQPDPSIVGEWDLSENKGEVFYYDPAYDFDTYPQLNYDYYIKDGQRIDYPMQYLPFCIYSTIKVKDGSYDFVTKNKTPNAYGYGDDWEEAYNNICFTGTHGARIDQGAILSIPGIGDIEYINYENYKVLPTLKLKGETGDGAYGFWINTDPSELRTRHTWNDTTTMICRKTDDENINADNWCIIYIKSYGVYAPTGALNNVDKVKNADAINAYLDAPYADDEGEIHPSGDPTVVKPMVFKVKAHIFLPNGQYGSGTIDMWHCDGVESRPQGDTDNFSWTANPSKTETSVFVKYKNLIKLAVDNTGSVDGASYTKISWISKYTGYNGNTRVVKSEERYNFYDYPHKGQA